MPTAVILVRLTAGEDRDDRVGQDDENGDDQQDGATK
jgi:hypothetical protein